jgi:nucleotide-binding universal stress UspA family protein
VIAECLLREGNTIKEIAQLAKQRNFELNVMGFGGESRIKELLFGNVSEGVAKHVSCPVLFVK